MSRCMATEYIFHEMNNGQLTVGRGEKQNATKFFDERTNNVDGDVTK